MSHLSTTEEVKIWFTQSKFSDLYDSHFYGLNGEVLFRLPIQVFVEAFGIVRGSGLYYMLNPNEKDIVLHRNDVTDTIGINHSISTEIETATKKNLDKSIDELVSKHVELTLNKYFPAITQHQIQVPSLIFFFFNIYFNLIFLIFIMSLPPTHFLVQSIRYTLLF